MARSSEYRKWSERVAMLYALLNCALDLANELVDQGIPDGIDDSDPARDDGVHMSERWYTEGILEDVEGGAWAIRNVCSTLESLMPLDLLNEVDAEVKGLLAECEPDAVAG